MSEPLRIAIAGLGTVGGGVLALLRDNAALLEQRTGRRIEVVAVSARDRGKDRGVALDGLDWRDDAAELAAHPAADVVVELIGGSEGTARALSEAALANGKHLVTANKALLAHHGAALAEAARRRTATSATRPRSPAASPSSRRCARASRATVSAASTAS